MCSLATAWNSSFSFDSAYGVNGRHRDASFPLHRVGHDSVTWLFIGIAIDRIIFNLSSCCRSSSHIWKRMRNLSDSNTIERLTRFFHSFIDCLRSIDMFTSSEFDAINHNDDQIISRLNENTFSSQIVHSKTNQWIEWDFIGILNQSDRFSVDLCMDDATSFQIDVQQFHRFFTGANFHFFDISNVRSTTIIFTSLFRFWCSKRDEVRNFFMHSSFRLTYSQDDHRINRR